MQTETKLEMENSESFKDTLKGFIPNIIGYFAKLLGINEENFSELKDTLSIEISDEIVKNKYNPTASLTDIFEDIVSSFNDAVDIVMNHGNETSSEDYDENISGISSYIVHVKDALSNSDEDEYLGERYGDYLEKLLDLISKSKMPYYKKEVLNDRILDIDAKLFARKTVGNAITYGEYDGAEKKITIYINAIKEYAKEQGLKFEGMTRTVLSHEVFLAMHHLYLEKEGASEWTADSYERNIVKESLASYSAYCYALDIVSDSIDKAILPIKIRDGWWPSMSLWPYSGAKYIFYSDFNAKTDAGTSFRTVFFDSLISFDRAFDDMISLQRITAGDFG